MRIVSPQKRVPMSRSRRIARPGDQTRGYKVGFSLGEKERLSRVDGHFTRKRGLQAVKIKLAPVTDKTRVSPRYIFARALKCD